MINEKKLSKKNQYKLSLTKAIIRAFLWPNILLTVLAFIDMIFRSLQPIFQGWIIDYFEFNNKNHDIISQNSVVLYSIYSIGSKIMCTLLIHHYFRYAARLGMRVRVACCSLLYRKVKLFFYFYQKQYVNLMLSRGTSLHKLKYIKFYQHF